VTNVDLTIGWSDQAGLLFSRPRDLHSGKAYDILASPDLESDPLSWTPWLRDIAATPPLNTTDFPMSGDSAKFFVVVEK
jgi:hypothetical protein